MRFFGFELPTSTGAARHLEVRWMPPLPLAPECRHLNAAFGSVRVWVYELRASQRIALARGSWDGETLLLRPIDQRLFDDAVQTTVAACLRTELQP